MKTLVPYKNEVKDVSIQVLKEDLSNVVLKSPAANDDKDIDLGDGQTRLTQ